VMKAWLKIHKHHPEETIKTPE